MNIKISPSIMCCKVEETESYIKLFEKVKLDSIHFDVMDGHYVKNCMLGTNDYQDLKRLTTLPVDLHFMTYHPEEFVEMYDVRPGDRVCFHPETTEQPYRLLQSIRSRGCKAGLAINPGTPVGYLEECAPELDYVMIMTINAGFAGQKMVSSAPEKIKRIARLLREHRRDNVELFVDGNTTPENSVIMRDAGAHGFVVGTSSLLKSLDTFEEAYHTYYGNLCA